MYEEEGVVRECNFSKNEEKYYYYSNDEKNNQQQICLSLSLRIFSTSTRMDNYRD